jgi:hypothetical protein
MSISEDIRFGRLTEVAIADLVAHMSDPRLREHMPLSDVSANGTV